MYTTAAASGLLEGHLLLLHFNYLDLGASASCAAHFMPVCDEADMPRCQKAVFFLLWHYWNVTRESAWPWRSVCIPSDLVSQRKPDTLQPYNPATQPTRPPLLKLGLNKKLFLQLFISASVFKINSVFCFKHLTWNRSSINLDRVQNVKNLLQHSW